MNLIKNLIPRPTQPLNPFELYIQKPPYNADAPEDIKLFGFYKHNKHNLKFFQRDMTSSGWVNLHSLIFYIGLEQFGWERLKFEPITDAWFKSVVFNIRQAIEDGSLIIRNKNTFMEMRDTAVEMLYGAFSLNNPGTSNHRANTPSEFYVRREDLIKWYKISGYRISFLETSTVSKELTLLELRMKAILETIKSMDLDPLALDTGTNGKNTTKIEIFTKLSTMKFFRKNEHILLFPNYKIFDSACQKLRDKKLISKFVKD